MSNIIKLKEGYNQFGIHFSRSRQVIWPDLSKIATQVNDGDKVLDLGCGNGRLLKAFKQPVHYTGVDFSSVLLEEAKKAHPKERFIQSDLLDKSLWTKLGQYQAIFCIAVLHHLESKESQLEVIENIHKHLATGGFAYLSVWNLLQPKYLRAQLKSWKLKLHNPRWLEVPFMNQWNRFCFTFDHFYLQSLCRRAGFKKIEVKYVDKQGQTTNAVNGVNLVARLEK